MIYKNKPWKANLSHYINHSIFGTIPNLTYFFIIDYDLEYNVKDITLVCILHGQFSDDFGSDIIGAGKSTDEVRRNNIRFVVN